MKYKGKKLSAPYVEIIPILRENEEIFLKAKAILDYSKFEQLCPQPKPPMLIKKGQNQATPNFEDPNYKVAIEQFASKRTAWMVIESLSATEDLEWEKVDPNNSDTWTLWDDELKDAGFSDQERLRIFRSVVSAQGLDEEKITEARNRFLQSEKGTENS